MLSVLLKKPIFDTVSNVELVEQMEAKKKCEKKLPTWFSCPEIYYPKKLNIEQTSSEITARYKSNLVYGKSLVDLTGGFGIDSYFFSLKIDRVFHCEIDENLSEIAQHNFEKLGVKSVQFIAEDGISFLKEQRRHFDWLYIDPSRRNDIKGKVFKLSDCLPDVSAHLRLLLEKADNLLIKTSPLLDISRGTAELQHVFQIHVVAVDNDVKELLWVLKKGYMGEIEVKTKNFRKTSEQSFNFFISAEKGLKPNFSQPQSYLYEPNSAIMKSGGFKSVGEKFHLKKLHPSTHLYTSNSLTDFPGRRFKIARVFPYSSKVLKGLDIKKANITVRNFPKSVAEIRKKHNIRDGGGDYLFFIKTLEENKVMILAHKT